MTISLANAGQRFESMLKTDQGFPFPGVIMPLTEGSVPSYDYSVPRHYLRLRYTSPINTGSVIVDSAGHRYLLADHDTAFADGETLYRSHKLFRMNKLFSWEREDTIVDALTGLAKGTGRVSLGQIWVGDEIEAREDIDLTFRVKEQARKIITGADIRENDILNDMIVRRIDEVMGIKLVEIQ